MTRPTKALTLHPIAPADRADWQRLWRAYLDFYQTRLPAEVYDSTFARLTGDDAAEFRGLIASLDGRAVGLVHYLFHRTCWAVADTCYLQDLYTDPAMRGQGIGRALIEAVYAAADGHGAASVYWMTQEGNTTARRLYDRIATLTPFVKYRRD